MIEEEEMRAIEAGERDNYDDAVDTIRVLAREVRALNAEMGEREAAGWSEFGEVAAILGYERGGSEDFGEVDVVDVRALAQRLVQRVRELEAAIENARSVCSGDGLWRMAHAAGTSAETRLRDMELVVFALLARLNAADDGVKLSTAEILAAADLASKHTIVVWDSEWWAGGVKIEPWLRVRRIEANTSPDTSNAAEVRQGPQRSQE